MENKDLIFAREVMVEYLDISRKIADLSILNIDSDFSSDEEILTILEFLTDTEKIYKCLDLLFLDNPVYCLNIIKVIFIRLVSYSQNPILVKYLDIYTIDRGVEYLHSYIETHLDYLNGMYSIQFPSDYKFRKNIWNTFYNNQPNHPLFPKEKNEIVTEYNLNEIQRNVIKKLIDKGFKPSSIYKHLRNEIAFINSTEREFSKFLIEVCKLSIAEHNRYNRNVLVSQELINETQNLITNSK